VVSQLQRTVDCVGVPLLLLLSDSALGPLVAVGTSRLLGNGGALEVVETGTVNSTASLLFFTDVLLSTYKETAVFAKSKVQCNMNKVCQSYAIVMSSNLLTAMNHCL
jgi:ABC-type sulfate transport system permease subunit